MVSKLSKVTGSRKKKELNYRTHSLSILVTELVNISDIKEMEYDARKQEQEAKDISEEWRQKYADLEKLKANLLHGGNWKRIRGEGSRDWNIKSGFTWFQ